MQQYVLRTEHQLHLKFSAVVSNCTVDTDFMSQLCQEIYSACCDLETVFRITYKSALHF